MKDRFEEQLNAKLQELESNAGDELDREAIWSRIAASQPKPVARPVWRPAIFKIAAAVVCLLGVALLLKFLADPSINKTELPLAHKPVAQPAPVNQVTPYKEADSVPNNKPAHGSAPVGQKTMVVKAEKKTPVTGKQPDGLQPADDQPVREAYQPLKQEIVIAQAQPKVMYLSDLDQENTVVPTPQKSRESGRIARYVKSNLEEYALVPPKVIINQILSK